MVILVMMIGEPPKQIGGSDPIPTFINHCFYGIFDPFLPKLSDKFGVAAPTHTDLEVAQPMMVGLLEHSFRQDQFLFPFQLSRVSFDNEIEVFIWIF